MLLRIIALCVLAGPHLVGRPVQALWLVRPTLPLTHFRLRTSQPASVFQDWVWMADLCRGGHGLGQMFHFERSWCGLGFRRSIVDMHLAHYDHKYHRQLCVSPDTS